MTRQQIFSKAVRHLYKQGRHSARPDRVCMYRGPNGTSCAIGCLIPDKKFRSSMEFHTVIGLNYSTSCPKSMKKFLRLDTDLEFMTKLQKLHDNNPRKFFRKSILAGAKLLANEYGLKMPKVTR